MAGKELPRAADKRPFISPRNADTTKPRWRHGPGTCQLVRYSGAGTDGSKERLTEKKGQTGKITSEAHPEWVAHIQAEQHVRRPGTWCGTGYIKTPLKLSVDHTAGQIAGAWLWEVGGGWAVVAVQGAISGY